MHKNTSDYVKGDGWNALLWNICEMVTYKSSLQVPAPAVVHEPDKTSPQEVPHQDGDVRYQHVRHRQPHEFLQGGTQEKGGGSGFDLVLFSQLTAAMQILRHPPEFFSVTFWFLVAEKGPQALENA